MYQLVSCESCDTPSLTSEEIKIYQRKSGKKNLEDEERKKEEEDGSRQIREGGKRRRESGVCVCVRACISPVMINTCLILTLCVRWHLCAFSRDIASWLERIQFRPLLSHTLTPGLLRAGTPSWLLHDLSLFPLTCVSVMWQQADNAEPVTLEDEQFYTSALRNITQRKVESWFYSIWGLFSWFWPKKKNTLFVLHWKCKDMKVRHTLNSKRILCRKNGPFD